MYARPDAAAAAKHLLLLLQAGALPEGAPLPFGLSVGDLVTQKNINLFTPSLCIAVLSVPLYILPAC